MTMVLIARKEPNSTPYTFTGLVKMEYIEEDLIEYTLIETAKGGKTYETVGRLRPSKYDYIQTVNITKTKNNKN